MMSTNRKNRKPVLRNVVKPQYIPQRSLLTVETKIDSLVLREIVDDINEEIQNLNCIIAERNIPYIRLEQSNQYYDLDKTRVVLRTESTDSQLLPEIENAYRQSAGNTFLIDLFLHNNGYVEIGYANDINIPLGEFSNFILVDHEYLSCALIDIFLDSAIFNSYSFLNELPPDKKRTFNKAKVGFLKSIYHDFTKFDSTFYKFNDKDYQYLSMAFFARESEEEVNLPKLIELWNKFVHKKFPDLTHSEPSVEEQLKSLVDLEQYTKNIIRSCKKRSKGSYWLLRIRREPVNEHIERRLTSIFGHAEIGNEKIILFEDLDSIYDLVQGQDITAFKFIVQ